MDNRDDKRCANWPTDNPGGMECTECGRIFIGGPEHSTCAICEADRSSRAELADALSRSQDAGRMAWEYSFIHRSATGRGDSKVGPCLTYDREQAFGVGCIEQREVFISPSRSQDVARVEEGYAIVQIDRSYDMRAKAIIAFNSAEKSGKDRDDALDAAWREMLSASPQPPQAGARTDDVAEGLEILDNLIDSVSRHGNYSKEATLTFLSQARQCFAAPAAPSVAPTTDEFMRVLTEYEGSLQSEDETEIAPARKALVDFMRPIRERIEQEQAAPTPAAAQDERGSLTDDVLMRAIADTAARGHMWASRALSDYRVQARAAASPEISVAARDFRALWEGS